MLVQIFRLGKMRIKKLIASFSEITHETPDINMDLPINELGRHIAKSYGLDMYWKPEETVKKLTSALNVQEEVYA